MTMATTPERDGFIARLDRAADTGRVLRFWLRDDDAAVPTEALDRLIDLGTQYRIPMTLAIIPAQTDAALAARLASAGENVEVAVHGWSHANHAGPEEKKQELGAHRPITLVLEELSRGREKLAALHHARFVPMLIPPWNRIAPPVIEALPRLGFKALSTFGAARPAPLAILNTHVDIMDWHGSRGGWPAETIYGAINEWIDSERPGDPVIGILSHHLVHDRAAWEFLNDLSMLSGEHPGCRWERAGDLVRQPPKP